SALNFQGRTREARKVLVEVQGRFPKHYLLSFYLARFACRLGNVREARPFQSMSRAENPGNGKADKPKRYISVGVRNIIKATASGVYFLNASVGGQLFQESLKTKDLEEAKACRDARIANIRADQAEGRTGKEMPAFPHRMTGIEDVQRLAEWLEACNKRNVAVSKNEQARLLELIPASRALLRKLEMKLLFGGAGAVVRSDSDLIEAYAQANETVPLLSVGLPALPKQAGELGRCRAGS
ncbi:MAG TPA: hypothetical protein VN578_21450, partial [Candidatus Binatia bacterium]|nr:hypothetical protein [Candidatus Binatia bacterium]